MCECTCVQAWRPEVNAIFLVSSLCIIIYDAGCALSLNPELTTLAMPRQLALGVSCLFPQEPGLQVYDHAHLAFILVLRTWTWAATHKANTSVAEPSLQPLLVILLYITVTSVMHNPSVISWEWCFCLERLLILSSGFSLSTSDSSLMLTLQSVLRTSRAKRKILLLILKLQRRCLCSIYTQN